MAWGSWGQWEEKSGFLELAGQLFLVTDHVSKNKQMTKEVNVFATKPAELSLLPMIHTIEVNNQLL